MRAGILQCTLECRLLTECLARLLGRAAEHSKGVELVTYGSTAQEMHSKCSDPILPFFDPALFCFTCCADAAVKTTDRRRAPCALLVSGLPDALSVGVHTGPELSSTADCLRLKQ